MRAAFRFALLILLLAGAVRIVRYTIHFGQHRLQMDYAAMNTAGEALNAGLSPYENHVLRDPPIWDGTGFRKHSRFLYPPLAAELFRPLATMPYHTAKIVWMAISLAAAGACLVIPWLLVRPIGVDRMLIAAVVAVWFQPLIYLLERGQIDAITGALVIGAIACSTSNRRARQILAGALLALATLLKLHVIYLLPLVLLRRQWAMLAGYACGAMLLLITTLALCGPESLRQYLVTELPRISKFGETGTPEMSLDPAIFNSTSERHFNFKDGRQYEDSKVDFAFNATLVRMVSIVLAKIGLQVSASILSMILFVSALVLIFGMMDLKSFQDDRLRQLTLWYLMLTIVLLTAPLTWSMNAVWLIGVGVLLGGWCERFRSGGPGSLLIATIGLLLIAIPDLTWFLPRLRVVNVSNELKYVIGEAVLAIGLLGLLRAKPAVES